MGTLAWLRCRVNRRKNGRALAAGLLLIAASITGLAASAPDAKAEATALLAEVARSELATRVAAEPVGKAQQALQRADQMRTAGDQKHGAMLEAVALEWAHAAKLLGKTAEREKALLDSQTRAGELETKVFRAQTLVEQTVARRARAEEALRKLEEKSPAPSEVPVAPGAKPGAKP